jgi:hypothetical protein
VTLSTDDGCLWRTDHLLEHSGSQARISGSWLPTVKGSTPLEVNPFNMQRLQPHPGNPPAPFVPCFVRLSGSHTQATPITSKQRRNRPTKTYRCDCTYLCDGPEGKVVSERTWFRHSEYRAKDKAQRKRVCLGHVSVISASDYLF